MKTSRDSMSLLVSALPLSLAGIAAAASVTYDADLGTLGPQDGSGAGWNTADSNLWNGSSNVVWPNTATDEIVFGSSNGVAGAVTVGNVTTNKITFVAPGSGNYSLTGGTVTLAGTTPTLVANADGSIASALGGTAGLTKSGTGTLTLSGTNTYTGITRISAGSVSYTGAGSLTAGQALDLGTASGSRSVLNIDTSGTVAHGTGAAAALVSIGGTGASSNGAGAINLTSGILNLRNSSNYMPMGNGGYGSMVISGGTLNFTNDTSLIIGQNTGGLGSFVMSGGAVNVGNRLFIVGGGSTSVGVATLTGGTLSSNWEYKLADNNSGHGAMNVGTASAGNATVKVHSSNGIILGSTASASATGILNLNSGTVQFNNTAGPIKKGTGSGTVNLNGGTLQANAAGRTLIDNTPTSVNVYNGGLRVDTQANDATISANLLITGGNGLYPTGGVISQLSATGDGYIGAPLVTVTTSGSGTGATAVANIANGKVTGVTMTCPGKGYAAGDTVTFTFAGGGPSTAAAPFVHSLTAGDVASNGTGGLTKLGTGKLILTGANTFTGPIDMTGKISANVVSLTNASLSIHDFNPADPVIPLVVNNTLTTSGVIPVTVNGTFTSGQWPLILVPIGGVGGAGFGAFELQTGSLPRGVTASLVDNSAQGSVDLLVSSSPLTWKGNVNNIWDIDTTSNWLIGATAQKYLENDQVLFSDSATGSTSVSLNAVVQPANVTFDNGSKNYTLSGTGGIGGSATISKKNSGTATLLTINTTTGTTTVSDGTLQLGNGSATGSIAGPLVNDAIVAFNPADTSPEHSGALSGNGLFVKEGPGTQVITSPSNTIGGTFQVNAGTLQFGNATANSPLGTGNFEVASGARLHLNNATAVQAPTDGWASLVKGAGTLELSSAQAVNGSAKWGPDSATATPLSADFTGTLQVNNGRFDASPAGLGGTSRLAIRSNAQFLAWAGDYNTPIEIAGNGWGEASYPCGLRLAADRTATWAGGITLTADSGIMAQRGTSFTITGAITGAHQCEFYAGDPVGENGNLIVAPVVPGQNTYAATKINGRPNGSVVAGSAQAFSSGPLVVDNAILKLNGHDLGFASLAGAGGSIGNYHATTPATLIVGSDGTHTSYAGVLRDGVAAATLALTKTGAGTLTLTASQAYTGTTTVAQGKLALATASLADTAAVVVLGGAVLELNTGTSDVVGSLVLGNTTVPTGTYDASHPIYGAYFAGTGSIVVGGAYESWAASKGLTGNDALPEADPDKDGVLNLAEFYFDGNPLACDPATLPLGSLNEAYLTLAFRRRDDAETMQTQAIEYGTDLALWAEVALGSTDSTSPAGVLITVEENETASDFITVRIPRTLAAGGKLFGRVNLIK
jgi:autotransporter-associated beta strand protein